MNIVVISHYRGQEMFWSEGTSDKRRLVDLKLGVL